MTLIGNTQPKPECSAFLSFGSKSYVTAKNIHPTTKLDYDFDEAYAICSSVPGGGLPSIKNTQEFRSFSAAVSKLYIKKIPIRSFKLLAN